MTGCPRCRSLVVRERFVDRDSEMHSSRVWGWRCVICGGMFDPLILLHKVTRPEPKRSLSRQMKRHVLVRLVEAGGPTAICESGEE
jgi:hypothetical protein